jgi:hypothetical protein
LEQFLFAFGANFIKYFISAGLTLASQWKSQFDDSEETDNEWKQENLQSPEHRGHHREVKIYQII